MAPPFLDPAETPVWERQDFDGLDDRADRLWRLFEIWRDNGPTRLGLPQFGRQQRVDRKTFLSHAHNMSWRVRVREYDRYCASLVMSEHQQIILRDGRAWSEQISELIGGGLELAQCEVRKFLERSRNAGDLNVLRAGELVRLLVAIQQMARLHLGESTENVAVAADMTGLTDDELRTLRELTSKVG